MFVYRRVSPDSPQADKKSSHLKPWNGWCLIIDLTNGKKNVETTHHPPKQKSLTLRIMGSQNWWFGDPKPLLYTSKPLHRRVQWFLGEKNKIWLRSHSFMFCVFAKFFVAFPPMVFVATFHGFGAPVEGSWTVEPVVALDSRTLVGDFPNGMGKNRFTQRVCLLNKNVRKIQKEL